MLVNAILDTRSSADHPLGEAIEAFIRREDAERFIEEVRGDGGVALVSMPPERTRFKALCGSCGQVSESG